MNNTTVVNSKTKAAKAAQIRSKKARRRTVRTIGFTLYENVAADIVVIATLKTTNRKTGNMIQVWILNRSISPVDAIYSGENKKICFDCPHQGDKFQKRTCYVNMRYVQGIWKAYTRGRYAFLAQDNYSVLAGRKIRFGAYGEPICIPLPIVAALAATSKGWTGYTHQWRKADMQGYRHYFMASCDSKADAALAVSMGWRYFRVQEKIGSYLPPVLQGEIVCPASDEMGHKTQCVKCGLCNGTRYANDPRKNITIYVHGSGAKNFVSLQSLTQGLK